MGCKMDPLMLELPEVLDSARLLVRKYNAGDGKAVFALLERNNNREFLFPTVEEVATIKNVDAAEIKGRRHAAEWDARKRFVLGIWLKKDDLFVGEIWIEPMKWDVPSFEIGWFLDGGFQGKGLATEATKRSLAFLFFFFFAH